MSNFRPGSREWWLETALIAGVGLLFAAFLWDGPLMRNATTVTAEEFDARSRTLLNLIEMGCLEATDMARLRDGGDVTSSGCQVNQAPPTLP